MKQSKMPPVGSTGTLGELQVRPGDVVERTIDDSTLWSGEKTITPEGWIVDNERDEWGSGAGYDGFPMNASFKLIYRANAASAREPDDTPAHIITHEGREYDLTALETPPFLLPDEVYEALQSWPHGWSMLLGGHWEPMTSVPACNSCSVYRAKPAPVEARVKCWRVSSFFGEPEYGTCIKRADGSIDWSTWEPEA